MDADNVTYDNSTRLSLTGLGGLFKGEEAVISVGQRLTVGRSRMCEISVARTAECLRLGKEEMERHKSYRKISRKHLRISYLHPTMVEVEDLSTNGTLVNGFKIDRIVISGFGAGSPPIRVEFGEGELLIVEAPRGDVPSAEIPTDHEKAPGIQDLHEDLDKTPIP